jgi:hypothetical protein
LRIYSGKEDNELVVSERTGRDFLTYRQLRNREKNVSKIVELELEKDFRRNFPANQQHLILNGGQTVSTSIAGIGVDLR